MILYTIIPFLWAEEQETTEPNASDSSSTEEGATNTEDPVSAEKKSTEKKEKPPKATKEPSVETTTESAAFQPHIVVGMETGAGISTTDLRASFVPQWHVGVQFPYWQDRLGLVFQGMYHVSKMDGSGSSVDLTNGSYNFDIRQQEGELGLNLRVRIPEVPVVTPEIWLGSTVQLLQTTVNGKGGSNFPTSIEQDTRIGFHAALLGEYKLPPKFGYVIGGVHYTTYVFDAMIQGDVRNHDISPTIGYRYRFF